MQPLEQAYGRAVIVDSLASVELGTTRSTVYDREIGLHTLYTDPESGAEHYQRASLDLRLEPGPHRGQPRRVRRQPRR